MKKICIALDYNPSAEIVAKIGSNYAKALGAEIILAHVIEEAAYYAVEYSPIMGYESPFNASSLEMVKELAINAEQFLEASKEHLGVKNSSCKVLNGQTAEAIIEFCEQQEVDLLVIGTHSHSAVENVLMGNTAVKIVRHSKIPLLVVPTKK